MYINFFEKPGAKTRKMTDIEFDCQKNCLICGNTLNFVIASKNPNVHKYKIGSVIMYHQKDDKIPLQQKILDKCKSRNDPKAVAVKARIDHLQDLRAKEAKYHKLCLQKFYLEKSNRKHSVETKKLQVAFGKTCEWLDSQTDKQFSFGEIQNQMKQYHLQQKSYTYTHMKRKLTQYYGDRIYVAKSNIRKQPILQFVDAAVGILNESHTTKADETINASIKCVASVVKSELAGIHSANTVADTFPLSTDIDVDSLNKLIPAHLKQLIESTFDHRVRSELTLAKQTLTRVSLCHILMNAGSHQSYVSPLLLAVGLFIHQQTRSKVVIEVLATLGMCAPYSVITEFEIEAAVAYKTDNLHPALESYLGFIQWVGDNFDLNEDTLDGKSTTHSMGVITCMTPKHDMSMSVVKRGHTKASCILQSGNFGSIVKSYIPPSRIPMSSKFTIKKLPPPTIIIDTAWMECIDKLWIMSSKITPNPPMWQGFMSTTTHGVPECSAIVFNPMIPLNPNTDDCVYSMKV